MKNLIYMIGTFFEKCILYDVKELEHLEVFNFFTLYICCIITTLAIMQLFATLIISDGKNNYLYLIFAICTTLVLNLLVNISIILLLIQIPSLVIALLIHISYFTVFLVVCLSKDIPSLFNITTNVLKYLKFKHDFSEMKKTIEHKSKKFNEIWN